MGEYGRRLTFDGIIEDDESNEEEDYGTDEHG